MPSTRPPLPLVLEVPRRTEEEEGEERGRKAEEAQVRQKWCAHGSWSPSLVDCLQPPHKATSRVRFILSLLEFVK
jgi:hypothetical protein